MKFNYQARTKQGQIQSGTVEAPSRKAALNVLLKYGLYVTALEEAGRQPFYAKQVLLLQRFSRKDVVLFSRELAIMFKSRISLAEALRTLASQTKNPVFKETIFTIVDNVEGGTPLSQALRHYPKLFSPFYAAMVKSGEVSGNLAEVLDYLAEHLERELHFYSKLKGAIIYPALIIFVAAVVVTIMVFFVIPRLMLMLEETKQELPLITRVVMGMTNFIKHWGWLLATLLIVAIAFIYQYYKTSSGKRIFDKFFLKLPMLGDFLKIVYLSRFAGNLATLISGGLPIAQALEITAEITGNRTYQDIILKSREGVRKGVPISAVLGDYPDVFPPMFNQMVQVGEKTGTLDKTLMSIVVFYQKEVDRQTNILLSVLEPVLIVFLGLVVAGLMAAVLLPLYKAMSF